MKILTVCGSGLGSSFLIKLNVEKLIKDYNLNDIEVEHTDLSSATEGLADLFIMSDELAASTSFKNVLPLHNLVDIEELKEKLWPILKEKGIL